MQTNTTSTQPKKLFNQVRNKIRFKHYSLSTERAYITWIKQFILYHQYPYGEAKPPRPDFSKQGVLYDELHPMSKTKTMRRINLSPTRPTNPSDYCLLHPGWFHTQIIQIILPIPLEISCEIISLASAPTECRFLPELLSTGREQTRTSILSRLSIFIKCGIKSSSPIKGAYCSAKPWY